jgi:hypothetical protein
MKKKQRTFRPFVPGHESDYSLMTLLAVNFAIDMLPITLHELKFLRRLLADTIRFGKPAEWLRVSDFQRWNINAVASQLPLNMHRQSLWRCRQNLKAKGLIGESEPRPEDGRCLIAPNWAFLRRLVSPETYGYQKMAYEFKRLARLLNEMPIKFNPVSPKLEETLAKAKRQRKR